MTTTRDTHSNPVGCKEDMTIDDIRGLLTGESAEVLADRIGDDRDYAKYRQALTAIDTLLAAYDAATAERDALKARVEELEGRRCENCEDEYRGLCGASCYTLMVDGDDDPDPRPDLLVHRDHYCKAWRPREWPRVQTPQLEREVKGGDIGKEAKAHEPATLAERLEGVTFKAAERLGPRLGAALDEYLDGKEPRA